MSRIIRHLLLVALFGFAPLHAAELLNASYDVTREFYKELNPAFAQYWKDKTGESVTINQSHGGSTKQARSVVDGLDADVITMNRSADIDILAEKGKLIPANWQTRLPNNSVYSASPTVFLVRKGNPKQIKDWDDLVKPGVAVIIPNPKTSGNGKYSYLGAWGTVTQKGGDANKAKQFVNDLFKHVPVLDAGGRGATTTFAQRELGDVLLTFENEVFLIQQEFGQNKYEVVYPPLTVLAENPVALVDKVVDKKGTRKLAQAYLEFHFSPQGQAIAAKHYLRPQVSDAGQSNFKKLNTFTVKQAFGSWSEAENTHFNDGGIFDQIYQK
ncbi:sulfate ABC transporter substrate-binding protein [Methylophilus medardicus]|uniref:Sulfate ABC transporter substrate-binding protein n=1 Tax=Methylophilus medardicus TaxID=2588534 RepID=A0A5B8CSZ6_9PROT|nr:sulfate ABC transporter substrate-binding protein [Methylophilus medardicus]QDC44431.1 sulfate ABC transporter substrate-binding protein [Methylophilus medardicus]QDC49438.1 sulfate ABC transporter substrate-binding protein [Methylophilus medardicus]QDC53143.1 sulfate ABC transporter substrate-binding protein [Methylophilus medardicus]